MRIRVFRIFRVHKKGGVFGVFGKRPTRGYWAANKFLDAFTHACEGVDC